MVIFLTLDYELFLNDNTGSVQNCLIKPIDDLQRVCDKYNVRYTVFVDAAYLYMLDKMKFNNTELFKDYQLLCENIRWIHSKGHEVQLHIHPQWYYSEYKDGEWILDWNHYRLADVEKKQAVVLFKESKELLDSIVGRKTKVFRAGGYSLPGFDYVSAFRSCGIIADSSVLPDYKEVTSTHVFDYRGTPDIPYRFNNNVCSPAEEGQFLEFPISFSKRVFFINYIKRKKHYMSMPENNNWGDGGDNPKAGILNFIRRIHSSFSFFKHPKATIDYQSFFFLEKAYLNSRNKGYMTIIGHPKNFSVASLAYLDSFINNCKNNGDVFSTIEDYCFHQLNNIKE